MTPRRFASVRCSMFNCQTTYVFVARMERSEIREQSPRQNPGLRCASSGLRTCVIAPLSCPARGSPVSSCLPCPRGVRNDRAFHRARGARTCLHAGIPHAAFAAHGQWPSPTPKIVELNRASEADPRLRSAREWTLRLAACPRGCHWRRRAPVRASCRPDMHLDRPPVVPASVPVRSRISDPQRGQGPAS